MLHTWVCKIRISVQQYSVAIFIPPSASVLIRTRFWLVPIVCRKVLLVVMQHLASTMGLWQCWFLLDLVPTDGQSVLLFFVLDVKCVVICVMFLWVLIRQNDEYLIQKEEEKELWNAVWNRFKREEFNSIYLIFFPHLPNRHRPTLMISVDFHDTTPKFALKIHWNKLMWEVVFEIFVSIILIHRKAKEVEQNFNLCIFVFC